MGPSHPCSTTSARRSTAVEAELGGPQQFFEINATPQLVNLFVAVDGATQVAPYVYVGGELAPAADPAGADGPTFGADALSFDPDTVLDAVAADLPDADVELFSIAGDPVQYRATVQSGDAGVARGRARCRRLDPVCDAGRLTCRGASTPPWYGEISNDHLGTIEAPDGQEPGTFAVPAALTPAGQERRHRVGRRSPARVHRHRADHRRGADRPGGLLQPRRSARARRGNDARVVGRPRSLRHPRRPRRRWHRTGVEGALVEPRPAGHRLGDGRHGGRRHRPRHQWARQLHRPGRHVHLGRLRRCRRRRTAAGTARPGRRLHPPARPRHRRRAA